MSGHFTSHYLAEILRDFYFQESSGEAEFREPNGRWIRLHFDRGMLFFAEGSDPQDHIEPILVSGGTLPQATTSRLRAATSSSLEMATRLVASKVLTPQELAGPVRGLLEVMVQRAFGWPSGTYEFKAAEAPPQPGEVFFEPDVLFTFECILRGITKMAYFAPLKEVLLSLAGRVRLSEKLFIPVNRLALKPHDGYLLSRVDGTMRIEEIVMTLPPDEEDESLQFLYGLAVLGIVEFVPPVNKGPFSLREVMQGHNENSAREQRESAQIQEMAARIVTQTALEILGVGPGDDRSRLQQAFDQARARFRRARFTERTQHKHKKDLSLIENKLAEAFLKLQVEQLEKSQRGAMEQHLSEINPEELVVRREMVKTEAQETHEQNSRLAEKYYQKAREHFAEKAYHDCIQFCQLAVKFNPESAPAYAMMAEALSLNPNSRWQRLAEEAYQRACELDPWNAEYQVALGQFYQGRGMELRARKRFEKALEILPSHAAAKAALKGSRR